MVSHHISPYFVVENVTTLCGVSTTFHPILWSSGHVVKCLCGQVVIWSSGHLVPWLCGQVVVCLSGQVVVVKWSSGSGCGHVVVVK